MIETGHHGYRSEGLLRPNRLIGRNVFQQSG
jgi:hypothetical protein